MFKGFNFSTCYFTPEDFGINLINKNMTHYEKNIMPRKTFMNIFDKINYRHKNSKEEFEK